MSFYYDPNSVLKKEENEKENTNIQNGPALSLPDQMLSKKAMLKVKDEVSKIKELVTAMQMKVDSHHTQITTEIVDNTRLNITVELLESSFEERMRQLLINMESTLKPKIKKRFKEKQLKKLLE